MSYVSENTRRINPFEIHNTLDEAIESALEYVDQDEDPSYWRDGDKIRQNPNGMPDFTCFVYETIESALIAQLLQDPEAMAHSIHMIADAIESKEKSQV